MTFTPSHKVRRNRVFTDREGPVGLFLHALDFPPPVNAQRALVFYGVGGEGKTALARHLREQLEREYAGRAGWASVNFGDSAMLQPAKALLSLRLELRHTSGLPFPAFDTAFAHWFGKAHRGANIREHHPELFRWRHSDDLKDALDFLPDLGGLLDDALGEVPGLGFVYTNLHRFHARFREWMERRGKAVLRGVEGYDRDELLDRLPTFLGADLADAVEAMVARGDRKPLAIIADTVEALHKGAPQRQGTLAFRNDAWLRLLIKEAPGVLFVLLGRERLRWPEVEPGWEDVLEQHRLGALVRADAERYLLAVPVTEPEVRARIVGGASGLPFYLDLQVAQYEGIKNQGREPEPAEFGGSEPEILPRFLDHVGAETTRALEIAAHCRRLSEELWLDLARALTAGLPLVPFPDLAAASYVEEVSDGWLALHALMREALCERVARGEPALHGRVHRRLFAWWDERCQVPDPRGVVPAHELAIAEAAFHRAAFDRETFWDWAIARGPPFLAAGRYRLVRDLYERALLIQETLPAVDDARTVLILRELGAVQGQIGDFDGSMTSLIRALEIWEGTHGAHDLELAPILAQIGDTYKGAGLLEFSLNYLHQAGELCEQASEMDSMLYVRILDGLSDACRLAGDLDAAAEHAIRACRILTTSSECNSADVMYNSLNLATIAMEMGDNKLAQDCAQDVLTICERELTPDSPPSARALSIVAMCHWHEGHRELAVEHLDRSLTMLERIHGCEHNDVFLSLTNLASIHMEMNNLEQANVMFNRALAVHSSFKNLIDLEFMLTRLGELTQRRGNLDLGYAHLMRALKIRELISSVKPDRLIRLLMMLGENRLVAGDLDAAVDHLGRALAVLRQAPAPNEQNLAETLRVLGTALQLDGRFSEAMDHLQQALPVAERAFGPDHHHVGLIQYWLALCLGNQGEVDAAIAYLQGTLTVYERALPRDHPDVADAALDLGTMHLINGSFDEAAHWFEHSLQVLDVDPSPNQARLAQALHNLGLALWSKGQPSAALDLIRRALPIRELVLPPEHPDFLQSLADLGMCLTDAGDTRAAVGYLERARAVAERVLDPGHPALNDLKAYLEKCRAGGKAKWRWWPFT